MSRPLVSIGLPVWNGENYLEECLRGLVGQTYDELEIIVGDNGSTDATEEICRAAAKDDDRIVYLRSDENKGAAWNYNRVFLESHGSLFTWAAHDDLRTPDHTAICVERFEEVTDDVVLVFPRAVFIDADGRETGPDPDRMETTASSPHRRVAHTLMTVNMASPVFGLIRSDVLRRTRLIGPFTASDYVLLVELAMLGQLVEVPKVGLLRRIHASSSREANRTRASVTAWFDPSASTPRLLSDRQRLLVEYTRSAQRLVDDPVERWICTATIPTVFAYRRARVVGGKWKQQILDRRGRA